MYPLSRKMARTTSKFRLYPNRQQRERLTATLDVCRELYNAGLPERIESWKNRTPVRAFDQINQLPDIKKIRPDVAVVFSQVLQDTLRRLDKTCKAFFGRVQRGQKAGFPRFQGRNRYDSFTYPQSGSELGAKLQLPKIGNIRIKQHRDVADEIKALTIRGDAGNWYACFSVEYEPARLPHHSQECPQSHAIEKKSLSERVHRCDCGLTIGRDHAAALIILGRGLRPQAQTDRQLATVA